MRLSKKIAEDQQMELFGEPTPESDSLIDSALDKMGTEVEKLGYTDFDFELIDVPFDTNRGKLLAKGTFRGPSPFAEKSRAPEDLSEFSFNVLFDEKLDATFIEVKHESALIATYQIEGSGISLIEGEIPHV